MIILWTGRPINPGSISAFAKRLFFSSKTSRPVLVLTQPSVELISVSLSKEVKRPEHVAGDFQVRHPRCVEYKLKYYIYIKYSHTQLYILLDYNSSYMFRPNCRAIFRLIFEQVACTIDNVFKALSIVYSACSEISLKMALQLDRNM